MMQELRFKPGRDAFSAYTLGVAFTFVAYALLKAVEDIADDSYEGVGHLVIGAALLFPGVLRLLRGRAPFLWLSVLGAIAVVVGLIDLYPSNVPWHVPLLIGAGLWIAQQRAIYEAAAR